MGARRHPQGAPQRFPLPDHAEAFVAPLTTKQVLPAAMSQLVVLPEQTFRLRKLPWAVTWMPRVAPEQLLPTT